MSTLSELYKACRSGDLSTVERLLPTLSIEEINQLQSNGSTSLHAASFYGHIDIVRLLLEKGARRNVLKVYKLTPADEAGTTEIEQLFNRSPTEINKRFTTAATPELQWVKSGTNVREISLANIMYAVPFKNFKEAMKRICEAEELHNAKRMDQIRYFLKYACQKKDPSYLLRAYTAETDFYHCLNRLHAEVPFRKYTANDRQKWFIQFVATVGSKEQNTRYGWKGVSYRGMFVIKDDLTRYKVDQWMANKTFQSTSKNVNIARGFIKNPKEDQLTVMCKYNILRDYDAFDISSISEYPHEEEVLLFPNTPFQVKNINMTDPIEIEFT
jgi:hypothetical protein